MTDRRVLALTTHDRQRAATEIFRAHRPDEIKEIIGWAERDIAERLHALVARFPTNETHVFR
jgi:hypothetical protein